MSHCCNHHKHTRHRRHSDRPGVVRRVTRGLGEKFGVPRKLVLAGFIVGLIMNPPLTIVLFLVALYWVDHPGQLEIKLERLAEKSRRLWAYFSDKSARGPAYAGAGAADPGEEVDFADLRRQFDDLERRAGDMEAHVSSEEFHLHKEFDRMRGGDKGNRS